MTNEEMIEAIKANYPTSNYTMLREALDKSIELLEEDAKELPEYNQDEAVEFIKEALVGKVTMLDEQGDIIISILDAEEDYMRSKGIIED